MNPLTLVEDRLYHWRRIRYLLRKYHYIQIPLNLVERGNADIVETYFRTHLGIADWTIDELRSKAAELRLSPIWGVSKFDLIFRINNELERRKEITQSVPHSQG